MKKYKIILSKKEGGEWFEYKTKKLPTIKALGENLVYFFKNEAGVPCYFNINYYNLLII